MNFIKAVKQARKRARARDQEISILYDPMNPARPNQARYFALDEKELADNAPQTGEIIAIVYPDGRIEG